MTTLLTSVTASNTAFEQAIFLSMTHDDAYLVVMNENGMESVEPEICFSGMGTVIARAYAGERQQ